MAEMAEMAEGNMYINRSNRCDFGFFVFRFSILYIVSDIPE